MTDIFRNSDNTIAAPDAMNSDVGVLHKRRVPSVRLPYPGSKAEPYSYMSVRLQELINELHYGNDIPLNSRAWVFRRSCSHVERYTTIIAKSTGNAI